VFCLTCGARLRYASARQPSRRRLACRSKRPSGREAGAGEGNRTLVISLEGCCSTIELHPRTPTTRHTIGPPRGASRRRPAFALRATARQPSRPQAGLPSRSARQGAKAGGGGRTRTYEGIASGFTVRPLCHSGHSPQPVEKQRENPAGRRFPRAVLWGGVAPVSTAKPKGEFALEGSGKIAIRAPA
jgi:hypothetical protein